MKLSMALIASELSGIINFSHFQEQNSAKVTGLKILSKSDTELDPDFVYFCQTMTLRHLAEQGVVLNGRCFIIHGNEYEDIENLLENSEYIFITEQTSLFSFINRLESIFLSYQEWERQMISLCASSASPQKVIDLAYEKIKIPMCMLDINHRVLAINKQVKTDDILYNSMLSGYGYPCVDIISTSNPTLPELDKCLVKEVINTISHHRLRVSTIRIKGRVFGYIGLHKQDAHPFAEYTLELYDILIDFLEQLAANQSLKDMTMRSSLFEQFMIDIIQNERMEEEILYRSLDYFKYKKCDDYKLYVCTFTTQVLRPESEYPEFMNSVEKSLPNMKCFHLNSYIGILSRKETENDLAYLKNILKKYGLKCALSNHFDDIGDVGKVWGQMMYVMENWKDDRREVSYDEYLMPHCISVLRDKFPFETLYHPAFHVLYQYDQENKTEYLMTLASYLQNKCSVSSTAAALYIHRNSLQYRIKKIEEILDFKIATSEEREKMLFSSFFVTMAQDVEACL